MSYVFYDVETTGLSPHFDQVIEFAAIRTDHQLNELDRFVVRSRLCPHIIPHPDALRVNQSSIVALLDPSRGSHYEMVSEIRSRLGSWSPAIFVGFNSIQFDEEFLRQALYQCLYPPYLTSQLGCGRADVLNLALDAAYSSPDAIVVPKNNDGRPSFRLASLASANGLDAYREHSALDDVQTTLALCRKLKSNAAESWQRFVRFSNKSNVASFVQSGDAFVYTKFSASQARSEPLIWVCNDPAQGAVALCLKANEVARGLLNATEEHIAAVIERDPSLLVRLRTNKAPALSALYDVDEDAVEFSLSFDEIEDFARDVHDRPGFRDRIAAVASRLAPQWPPGRFVEQQIYESFWSREDERIMARFHQIPWGERLAVVELLSDSRSKLLGLRLVQEEAPELLTPAQRALLATELALRAPEIDRPLGIYRALNLVDEMIDTVAPQDATELASYRAHLESRLCLHATQ